MDTVYESENICNNQHAEKGLNNLVR